MRSPHQAQDSRLAAAPAALAGAFRGALTAALMTALMTALTSLTGCEGPRPSATPPNLSQGDGGQGDGGQGAGGQGAGEQLACVPDCEGRTCGVDPRCGASCGDCAEGTRCEGAQCVPEAPAAGAQGAGAQAGGGGGAGGCAQTCESIGAECGEVCGVRCGVCAEGSACEGNACVCTPQCAGRACGEPDGCGGACSPCPRSETCASCAVRLRVLSLEERGGVVSGARVALSVSLPEGAPHPELADLQLNITGPALIGRVGLGDVVVSAGKQLVPNPATGLPYRASGSRYSFMIMSTQNTREIASGDWLIIDLLLGDTSAQPVQLSVVQREQTFAPPPADLQLWGASLGQPLVIWPALRQGE
jgi:hypothetical protein